MADKMMRIAGRSDDGLAKPIRTGSDGTLIVQLNDIKETKIEGALVVTGGNQQSITIQTKCPYKIFIRLKDNFSGRWSVLKSDLFDTVPMSERSHIKILESNGTDAVIGNGARSEAYSNLQYPVGKSVRLYIKNDDPSDITFDVFMIEYPIGHMEPTSYDEPFKTNEISKIGRYFTRSGELTDTKTVFSSTKPTTLDYLEFSTNHLQGGIQFDHRKADGTYEPIGMVLNDGSDVSGFNANSIVNHASGIWMINSYESGKYKFTLKEKWHFPNGCQIKLYKQTPDVINAACRGYVRELR